MIRDIVLDMVAERSGVLPNKVTEEMFRKFNDDIDYSIEDSPINNWDEYFLNLSIQVSRNSKCLARKVGAVLVRDKSIISTGYNGPPRGIPTCDKRWEIDPKFISKYNVGDVVNKNKEGICPRKLLGAKSGQMLDVCVAGHAEENAIVNSARMGVCTKGAKLFLNCGIPCSNCMIKIINSGISEVIVTSTKLYDDNSEYLINNHKDIKVRLYNF